MKCEICDCEAVYRVWKYAFCKNHYVDLEKFLVDKPSLHIVNYFVKTRGSMIKDNAFERFYDKFVSKL